MVTFSVRVPDTLAQSFDAAASPFGGRSARLRQLIQTASGAGSSVDPTLGRRDGARVMVRLAAVDVARLDEEAARMGLRRAAWVAALVRRRVRDIPAFSPPDAIALQAVQVDLRRIGVNVNEIARALKAPVLERWVIELEMAAIEDLRGEVRAHLRGLRAVLAGNLAYWDIAP